MMWCMWAAGFLCATQAHLADGDSSVCVGTCRDQLLPRLAEEGGGSFLLQTEASKMVSQSNVEVLARTTNTTTTTKLTGAGIVGIAQNDSGDFAAFWAGLMTNIAMTAGCYAVFLVARRWFPGMYQYNTQIIAKLKEPPLQLSDRLLSPVLAAWRVSVDDCVETVGLDHAMLLQFSQLVMNMMLLIGAPALVIMMPLYGLGGGHAADNRLSYYGFNNVQDGNWMCWPVAFFVWYVVIAVEVQIFRSQENTFMHRRKQWLMTMPLPRANTVLLESIPAQYHNDDEIKRFFNEIFGEGSVTAVSFVKDTSKLLKCIKHRDDCSRHLHEAEFEWDKTEKTDETKKTQLSDKLKAAEDAVQSQREETVKSISGISNTAFVTFRDQQQSIMALNMRYTEDDEEFVVSVPPDPSDVRYSDLLVDYKQEMVSEAVGYGLIAGLFFGFIPLVALITNITSLESMEKVSFIKTFFDANPSIAALWSSLAASLGLNIFMSFLPTFLVLIFSNFFALKADAWLQHDIQKWYFYFLVIFVLLVTAVGTSLWDRAGDLIQDPTAIFPLLASTLPAASHFYLNYIPLQWGTHAMNMLRYMNVIKYLGFKKVVSAERAREKAEPEDQDYYGMGSRSARHTLVAVIGLTFCTITPLITPLVFFNGVLCRTFYGYLVVYAEQPKADLGGVFWVTQLRHLQQGLVIYIILMTGVLLQKGQTIGPAVVAASSLAAWILSYNRFNHKFHIESLPLKDMKAAQSTENRASTRSTYDQPELEPPKSDA